MTYRRLDGDVRVTDRVSGASVRATCRSVVPRQEGESLISVVLETSLSGEPMPYRDLHFETHGVECASVAEMRCVIAALDALLDSCLASTDRRPVDLHVHRKPVTGSACDWFGEVDATAYDEGDESA